MLMQPTELMPILTESNRKIEHMKLHNNKVLVTGGTSGIGYALSQHLLAEGHKVVVVARDMIKLEQLQERHDSVTSYCCDLTSRVQVEELADKLITHHPDLSVIINNAGLQFTPTLLDEDFSYDAIEPEMTVNFLTPVWLTALLLPRLLELPEAAVVNISSGLALAPKTNSAIYCASKAALHSFSQSLRYQLEETNVHIYEVILPLVDTPMTQGRGSGKLTPKKTAADIINGIKARLPEIYIGKARLLPWLMRLSPSLVKGILRRY